MGQLHQSVFSLAKLCIKNRLLYNWQNLCLYFKWSSYFRAIVKSGWRNWDQVRRKTLENSDQMDCDGDFEWESKTSSWFPSASWLNLLRIKLRLHIPFTHAFSTFHVRFRRAYYVYDKEGKLFEIRIQCSKRMCKTMQCSKHIRKLDVATELIIVWGDGVKLEAQLWLEHSKFECLAGPRLRFSEVGQSTFWILRGKNVEKLHFWFCCPLFPQ